MTPLRIAALGFPGSAALALDQAIRQLDPAEVSVVEDPAGADAALIQGVHTPMERAVLEAVSGVAVVAVGQPVTEQIRNRSRGLPPGIRARVEQAMQVLSPASLAHALRLIAHSLGRGADPGDCQDDRPAGWWECGRPLSTPVHRCGVAVPARQIATGDTASLSALVEALRERGIEPLLWAGDPGECPEQVPLWLNLTGFTLRGSHAEPKVGEGIRLAGANDAQILTPVPLQRTELEDWLSPETTGLSATQVSMNIAIPEFEGAVAPWVFAGRSASGRLEPVAEHIDLLAERVWRTLRLRSVPVAERKISITVFGHDATGTVGTAAQLDVFASLHGLLTRLRREGYTVTVPDSVAELTDMVVGSDGGGFRSASTALAHWPAQDYAAALGDHAYRIDRLWGRLPGLLDTTGRDMIIRGSRFGNVIVGVQPNFGDVADPLDVLTAEDAAPSHSFAAYYLWLEHHFGHDLMLHFGTHGALEFMPGRSTGLLPRDWPVLLGGAVPHAYLYAMSNPAEGTVAKRRSAAQLVSYLTPVLADAGLPGALSEVAELSTRLQDLGHHPDLAGDLARAMERAGLSEFKTPHPADDSAWLKLAPQLTATVERIRRTPIALGLHVLGQPMPREATGRILEQAATYPLDQQQPLSELVGGEDQLKQFCESVIADRPTSNPELSAWWEHLRRLHRQLSSSAELDGLVCALSGGYVKPAPGGEPARSPAALPTGRNTHGVDPAAVPTPTAVSRGARVAEELLARTAGEDGRPPRQVALVIWGTDNIKTGGEGIAQAFRLIGAEPLTGPHGRVDSYRILETDELNRARVDITCTVSGVGRDIFGGPLELLDRAIREIAELDEPDELNPLKAHAHAQATELGLAARDAATRIWSAAPGRYGTGVNKLVQSAQWEDRDDLSEIYLHRMGHAWGADLAGEQRRDLLRATLNRVEVVFQNIDSAETSLAGVDHYFEYLGGTTAAVEKLRGAKPATLVNHAWSQKPVVEPLEQAMRLESRTRLLNPKWWRAQLEHGYQGVGNIRTRFENTFGFAATADAVDPVVFERVAETFLLDREVREELAAHNPAATAALTNQLLEAADRRLWDAQDQVVAQLEELAETIDDHLEGITRD